VSHTLAETYAVLTTLPVKPRISPLVAQRLIGNNLQEIARIVPLTIADYWTTIQRMTAMGLSGGTIYDALIAAVARRLSTDKLLTLNTDDFRRVWPEGNQVISTP
jgi:predicted nucleic acid-binding protein